MKKKNVFWAIILIMIAVYLVTSRLQLFPAISFFKILFTIILAYVAVHGFARLHFVEGMLSIALLGCIYDKVLKIEAITPWTLLLAGLLIGIALDMLFRNGRKQSIPFHNDHILTDTSAKGLDGASVHIENTFGAVSRYIHSDCFEKAHIENSFGECNVYFNQVVLNGTTARLVSENSFGSTNLYLPSNWRITVKQETTFGNIEFKGSGSTDPDAPCVELKLSCCFGEICVIFE